MPNKRIFGSCQERAKENAANIEQSTEFTESLVEEVINLQSEVIEIFSMVLTELAAFKSVQKEVFEIQNPNWIILQKLFGKFEHKHHV